MADIENDTYVKQWVSGLIARTKENYLREIEGWNTFLGLTPTEQIQKRMHDLTSQDLTERQFFEQKFREYKASMENEGKIGSLTIKTRLRTVASFFGRTVGKLNLRRGDWNSARRAADYDMLVLQLASCCWYIAQLSKGFMTACLGFLGADFGLAMFVYRSCLAH